MSGLSTHDYRESKDPRYNAKRTIAVTPRVLYSWCARADVYLWNVENCQRRAMELQRRPSAGSSRSDWPMFPDDERLPYLVVAYDNLEYGLELTLKAAQMVDGYHGLNDDLDIPGRTDTFEVDGLTYVYVPPTHRLDVIYDKHLSLTMKDALQTFFPLAECITRIYNALHPESLEMAWGPGTNYRANSGNVRYDSKRYTSDWMMPILAPEFILGILAPLRDLNGALPLWLNDRELKARPS